MGAAGSDHLDPAVRHIPAQDEVEVREVGASSGDRLEPGLVTLPHASTDVEAGGWDPSQATVTVESEVLEVGQPAATTAIQVVEASEVGVLEVGASGSDQHGGPFAQLSRLCWRPEQGPLLIDHRWGLDCR